VCVCVCVCVCSNRTSLRTIKLTLRVALGGAGVQPGLLYMPGRATVMSTRPEVSSPVAGKNNVMWMTAHDLFLLIFSAAFPSFPSSSMLQVNGNVSFDSFKRIILKHLHRVNLNSILSAAALSSHSFFFTATHISLQSALGLMECVQRKGI
jgi:hypothetical protein